MITVEWKNIVLQKVIDQEIGTKKIDPVKHLQFINAVKVIIDHEEDIQNGFILEFNNAFTKLIKRKNEFFKPK